MAGLTLVNPQHRITKAMVETIQVMPPDGSVMTLRQIAQARWPDHPCWEGDQLQQRNVLSGLACTTGRLREDFCLFALRKHHYVITRFGCETAGLTPTFSQNDHLGDYFEFLIDVFLEDPRGPRGLAALECFHYWALENHGDLPDINRARALNRRIIELLCSWPQLRFRGKGALSAARTIYELCVRCKEDRIGRNDRNRKANRALWEPLVKAGHIETLSWSSRHLIHDALFKVVRREDYKALRAEHGIDLNTKYENSYLNASWGAQWQLTQEEL